jgi:CheY-like chemotaxis protein
MGANITCYSIQEAKMRLRILLAEDNVVNQRPTTELLQGRGHYERYI